MKKKKTAFKRTPVCRTLWSYDLWYTTSEHFLPSVISSLHSAVKKVQALKKAVKLVKIFVGLN